MRVVKDHDVLKNGEVGIHYGGGKNLLLGDGRSKAIELVEAIHEFNKSIYAPKPLAPKKTTRKKVVKDAE